MKLEDLKRPLRESFSIGGLISYLGKALGQELHLIPGVEHYKNSDGEWYGQRYVEGSSIKCLRFNWKSEGSVGNVDNISSIDVFDGSTPGPNFNISTDGISIEDALPSIALAIKNPQVGSEEIFPIDRNSHIGESLTVEARVIKYDATKALESFVRELGAGKMFSRTEFINKYGLQNAGIYDAIANTLEDHLIWDKSRYGFQPNYKPTNDVKKIEKKAGTIEIKSAPAKETFFKSPQEVKLDKDAGAHVPYAEALVDLESLVDAIIKGASNALFVAGRGGCLSRDTELDVLVPLDDEQVEELSEVMGFDLDDEELGLVKTIEIKDLEHAAKIVHSVKELELDKFYPISGILLPTPDGFRPINAIVRKRGFGATVFFDNDEEISCLVNHLFIDEVGFAVQAQDLYVGKKVMHIEGPAEVVEVILHEEEMDTLDVSIATHDGLYFSGNGILHHNTGKTQTVEQVLAANGLTDGNGYFKNSGGASPVGIYSILYHHRHDIILFDDSDGALADQDARNIIKAATDTKKIRKLSWSKKSNFVFDPDVEDPEAFEGDLTMAPNSFDFYGKIIFISNLSLDKLDPDGALRTRALVINVDPTDAEMFDHMGKILYDITLENGKELSNEERDEVLNVVKGSSRKGEVSIRKLVRALNLAASGLPQWRELVSRYS